MIILCLGLSLTRKRCSAPSMERAHEQASRVDSVTRDVFQVAGHVSFGSLQWHVISCSTAQVYTLSPDLKHQPCGLQSSSLGLMVEDSPDLQRMCVAKASTTSWP